MQEQESELKGKEKTPSQSNDFSRLRSLVLGEDYEGVIKNQLNKQEVSRVSDVVSEALVKRHSQDDSVINAISPIVESSIDTSIKKHPERITNVFFPIIGPLVRKAVASALSDLVHNLNYLLQQGLTARALVWRYKAWRLGVPYGQYALLQTVHYQVEQAFLIHKESGLLIKSAQAEGISYQDPDLVSSMLSAISDFANDSFEQSSQGLETIQFGDLSLLIETGPYAVLAFAVRGTVHNDVKKNLSELNERIHSRYAEQARLFDGDTSHFEGCVPWLESALIKKQKKDIKTRPWFAIFAMTLATILLLYWFVTNYQTNRSIEESIQIANQNGYQVVNHEYKNQRLQLDYIKSTLAISQNELTERLNQIGLIYDLNEVKINQDLTPLYLAYLEQKYATDLSINSDKESNTVTISGVISEENLEALVIDPMVVGHFNFVQAPELVITPKQSETEKARAQLTKIVDEINSQFFYFEVASELLTESSQQNLEETIRNIKLALNLQSKAQVTITQITVSGFADHQGTQQKNIELSQKRAQYVRDILQKNNINKELIVSWGGGVRDLTSVPSAVQRRVKIEIFYSPNGVEENAQ